MRNFIIALLAILIGLAFWPDPREEKGPTPTEEQVEQVEKTIETTPVLPRTVTTTTVFVTTSTLFPTTTIAPLEATQPRPQYPDLTTTTQELTRRQQRSQKAFELAQEKLKTPIQKEIARAVPFKKWPRDEVSATGFYQGKIQIDGQEHVLRLNFLFHVDTGMVTPNTCAALFTREKVVFRESFRGSKLRFLSPPEKGYFIISVLNRYNISLFQIGSGSARVFQANLSLPGKAPLALQLEEVRRANPQDRCLQVY